jgi:hypothetical protein
VGVVVVMIAPNGGFGDDDFCPLESSLARIPDCFTQMARLPIT